MPALKLTIIGAGSAFTFRVVSDLIRRPALAGSTVALVDVDEEALALSARIAARMVERAGAQLTIRAHHPPAGGAGRERLDPQLHLGR